MVKGYYAHTYTICHSSGMFGRSKFNDGTSEQLQVLYKSELQRLWLMIYFQVLRQVCLGHWLPTSHNDRRRRKTRQRAWKQKRFVHVSSWDPCCG